MTPVSLSVVILTQNEERNLPACLASVRCWTQEIILIDSGSTDSTRQIASCFDAKVFEHAFESHARQWEWALENVPIANAWVFGLDADQRVMPELRDELVRLFGDARKKLA